MNKFFIYIRKSTNESNKQVLSLEAQETELLEFARKDRLEVAKTLKESQTAYMAGLIEQSQNSFSGKSG